MAGRKKDDRIIFSEQIVQKSMEEVMHDSMMPYSEYVILERALPRAAARPSDPPSAHDPPPHSHISERTS